jgi:phage-related protein
LNYPIVFDKFETNYNNFGLAILDKSKNVKVSRKLTGEYTLTLWLPRNDDKWQYIQNENFKQIEGQLFRIKTTDEQRDGTGKLISNIQCQHVW